MRGRVLYVGRDPDLPAFLSAYGTGGFSVSAILPEKYKGEPADLLLWDLDAAPVPDRVPAKTRLLTVGYTEQAAFRRPFAYADFEAELDPVQTKDGRVLSTATRELFSGDARVRLSPLEYDLLSALLSAEGETVSAARLSRVGGRDLSPHALSVAIFSLRRKLDRLPDPPRVAAERGEGYRLIPARRR